MDHVADVLRQLFVLLLAAKVGDELFKRIGQPAVIGEILAGAVVGPALLGWYRIDAETSLFAEIGVVLLLFQVGIETRLGDLLRVGLSAASVGALGVALPFAGGYLVAGVLGSPPEVAIFLAAALTATSVGITSGILRQLGALQTTTGRVILGAAVIDDVLAMLILAFASGVAAGSVSFERIAGLVIVAAAFIGIVLIGGTRLLRRRRSILTDPQFAATPFLPGMIIMLGLAALAAQIGLAAIIGAFLAGMVVGESGERHALETEVAPVAAFFTPFFFGFIGAQVDVGALADPATLALVAGITLIAVVTKFVGAFLGAIRSGAARAAAIGWGMVPRGEVGIVVAGLGLQSGAIDGPLYSVVVGMAVITTLIVPPFLPALVRRAEGVPRGHEAGRSPESGSGP
ncbi:MAG: cation:proton antiporter [Chloroflexota bacterium]